MALVLVTGGSGFIGHHLVEALRARGQRVRVLDVRPPAAANADVEYAHGSVLDGAAVVFEAGGVREDKAGEAQVGELYRQIGQLKVENDFLAKRLGK